MLVFFVYAAWMIGPYPGSVMVRNAAVTTRATVSTSPHASLAPPDADASVKRASADARALP